MSKIFDMLKYGAFLGAGGADWNQNDHTAPDFVKNRPFYCSVELTPIVDNGTVTVPFDAKAPGRENFTIIESQRLVPGKTYVVTWDGVEYECVSQNFTFGSNVLIGRLALTGGYFGQTDAPHNNEPFCIVSYGNGLGYNISAEKAGDYTFSIATPEEVAHKIPEKYLPLLTSPGGKKFKLSVDDNGTIAATEVT